MLEPVVIHWTGRRKGTKPDHLILPLRDGTVGDNAPSLCGMVQNGDRNWELGESEARKCRRCERFLKSFIEIQERRNLWRSDHP